ncbi:MAG: hypothetical protein ABIX28_24155 [Vicinamibacterales bacterium]
MAYLSGSPGQIYVQPYPALDHRVQVSIEGGTEPVWRRDGREMYYLQNVSAGGALKVRVMAVPVTTTPTFSTGTPHLLFEGAFRSDGGAFRNYDVSRRQLSRGQRVRVSDPTHEGVRGERRRSNRRLLFESPTASALGPVWSPREDRIASGVGVNQPRPGRFGPAQVNMLSPEGSELRRLTPDDDGSVPKLVAGRDTTRAASCQPDHNRRIDSRRRLWKADAAHTGLLGRQPSVVVAEG